MSDLLASLQMGPKQAGAGPKARVTRTQRRESRQGRRQTGGTSPPLTAGAASYSKVSLDSSYSRVSLSPTRGAGGNGKSRSSTSVHYRSRFSAVTSPTPGGADAADATQQLSAEETAGLEVDPADATLDLDGSLDQSAIKPLEDGGSLSFMLPPADTGEEKLGTREKLRFDHEQSQLELICERAQWHPALRHCHCPPTAPLRSCLAA